ncbi:MAG: flagellin [Sulfitobacter sp.]
MHISSGDLAQSFSMQTRNTALKQDIQRLTEELSSGRIADVRQAVGGNTAYVNDLERSLTKLDGYGLATVEAGQLADGMQTALSRIGTLNIDFRSTLLSSSNSGLDLDAQNVLSEARNALDGVIGALNTSIAGRMIFAGTATETRPVASSETLRTSLSAAVAGAGSVDDILAAAQNWFDDPAGYGTIGYLGSNTALSPITLSDTETTQIDVRGDNPKVQDMLRHLAIISLAGDPALGLSQVQQKELIQKTTGGVFAAVDAMTSLQAEVGLSEHRIEAASVRQSAERSSLEIARSNLLSSDPFQTATELEQVQFQLQSLYAITSRMSQLSLVNFL